MKALQFALSYFARFILAVMGWKQLNEQDLLNYLNVKPVVVVFPHTTYADFFFFMLYMVAYPEIYKYTHGIMNEYHYNKFYYVVKFLHLCSATKVTDRGKGCVNQTIEYLRNKDFIFFISPEGTISKAPWRSGYYAIASTFKCPVRVIGFDYLKKKICMFPPREFQDNRESLELRLQSDMRLITPRYPEDSFVDHNIKSDPRISFFDTHSTQQFFIWGSFILSLWSSGYLSMLIQYSIYLTSIYFAGHYLYHRSRYMNNFDTAMWIIMFLNVMLIYYVNKYSFFGSLIVRLIMSETLLY